MKTRTPPSPAPTANSYANQPHGRPRDQQGTPKPGLAPARKANTDNPPPAPPNESHRPVGCNAMATNPPMAEVSVHTVGREDTGSTKKPLTAGSTAPPSAPPAAHAADPTTSPTCAGNRWNTNRQYPSYSTPCTREHSDTRPGTNQPKPGTRDDPHPSRTLQSPSPP